MNVIYQTPRCFGRSITASFTSVRRKCIENNTRQIIKYMSLHTTPVRKALPALGPILVKLSSPLFRVATYFLGRSFRKAWKKLPQHKRDSYVRMFSKNHKVLLLVSGGFLTVSSLYYVSHLEKTPITGRMRFILVNKEHLTGMTEIHVQQLESSLPRLPEFHHTHMKVHCVVKRILDANASPEVRAIPWVVNVVESDVANAFVLPNGQIYVNTGMLDFVENEHQLAGVLAHEISHALLGHAAELASHSGFFNVFSLIALGALTLFVPTDGLAIFTSWVQTNVENVLLSLPYSRKLEREADDVGMRLAAKACYDVREVPKFWEHARHTESEQLPAWLSTHPSHKDRSQWLRNSLPQAIVLREDNNCPKLDSFRNAFSNFLNRS